MTSDEIARLLETFRKKFTPDAVMDPATVKLWNEQFRDTHRDLMRPAAKDCLANEESFPKPAKLRWYLKKHADLAEKPQLPARQQSRLPATQKSRSLAVPDACPEGCDHGWMESTERETAVGHRDGVAYTFTYPPGMYPCRVCRPDQFDRWHDKWVPQALSNQPIKATTTFPYNPQVMIEQQRGLLAALKVAVKDPDDLDSVEDL